MNILILEDDAKLNNYLRENLNEYNVFSASTLVKAYKIFNDEIIDLVLLDMDLGNESGLDFLRKIREESKVNVLPITADDSTATISECFELGCSDYITKPFSLNLLKVKLENSFRQDQEFYIQGNLRINFEKRICYVDNKEVKLTNKEFKLLEVLVDNRKLVLTKDKLIEQIWGYDNLAVNDNTVAVMVKRLRKKIEVDDKQPKYILTVFSIGYSWSDYGF